MTDSQIKALALSQLSSVKGATAKFLEKAYKLDKNGNLMIDFGAETVELQKLCKKYNVNYPEVMNLYNNNPLNNDEQFVQEIMGLEIQTVTKPNSKPAHNLSQQQINNLRNIEIPKEISKLSKTMTPTEILLVMEREYGDNEQLRPILNEIGKAHDLVQTSEYNSKDDVKNLRKVLIEDYYPDYYKENGADHLKATLVSAFQDAAKNQQIQKEGAEILEKFQEFQADNKNMTPQDCLEAFEKKLKETKYYGQSYGEKAYNAVKEDIAKLNARKEYYSELNKTTATTTRGVKKEIKATGDKEIIAQSNKEANRDVAYRNKVAERTAILLNAKASDITSSVPSENSQVKNTDKIDSGLWFKLSKNYLHKVYNQEKNTYDLQEIVAIFAKYAGDGIITFSENTEIAENSNILKALREAIGEDITTNEMKQLAKLCGYKLVTREKGFHKGDDVLTGLITGVLTSSKTLVVQNVELTFESELAEQFIKQLEAQGIKNFTKKITEDGNVIIDILQKVELNNLLTNLAIGAGVGLAVEVAKQLLWGDKNKFEDACISLNELHSENSNFETINELEKYMTDRYGQGKAEAVMVIAQQFANKNGNFDNASFKSYLADIAGFGSNITCDELFIKMLPYVNKKPEVQNTVTTVNDTTCNDCEVDVKEQYENKKCYNEHIIKKGDSWSTLIHTYYQDVLDSGRSYREVLNALREALDAKATDTDLPWLSRKENGKIVRYLEMPCELLGVQCVVILDLEKNREKYNVNKFATEEIQRSDGKEVEVKPVLTGYTATDGCDDTQFAWGSTQAEAIENLKKRTGKTYSNESDYQN